MKMLYVVRHAKSSWSNPSLDDFDRPLNRRGKKNAPFMAEILLKKKILPEVIIASPANRAFTTAECFAEILGYLNSRIKADENLYEADSLDILNVISEVEDYINSVMIFGHNPGLTNFVNFISDGGIENIPTTGVVCLKLNVNTWKDVVRESCEILWFDYPKKHTP
ncbi:MAG: histidine phosphatase family protein [Ignavibacteriales bacterium]|nr:MAG: histidine phosphatase family protein [Ignavibacteriales bacterium]